MSLARNRYQLADVLYEDPLVIAYRAQDTLLNRPVVVETVAPDASPDAAEQLMRKAQQAVRINLPHVAAIFNQYTENDQPFLVWEDITGQPVADLAPLPSPQAAEVASIVTETAQAALQRHLPLPPLLANNVYLGPDDQIHITNLGLHQGASTNSQAAVALGYLLGEMLGETSKPTALHTLAAQAMAGQFPTVDGFAANLKRVRQQAGAPTAKMSRPAPQTIDLSAPPVSEPVEQAVGAPVPRQMAYSAPVAPVRRSPTGAQRRIPAALPPRPTAAARRRGGLGWLSVLPLLAVLSLLAFFVLPRLATFVNGDDAATVGATTTATTADTQSAAPLAPASVVAVAPSTSASPSPSPSPSPLPSASPSPGGGRYVVASTTGQNLRVRAGPGTSAQPITTLPNGTVVDVVSAGQQQNGYTWVQIRSGSITGWCILEGLQQQSATASATPSASAAPSAPASAVPSSSASPLPSTSPQPSALPQASPTSAASVVPVPSGTGQQYVVATITGEQLVVRNNPGGDRITSIPNGTVVEVTGPAQAAGGNNWLQIRVANVQGWVIAGGIRRQ